MIKYLLLLLVLCFITACDEPPPQWRDDQPPVDNTVIDHDVAMTDNAGTDAADDPDTTVLDIDTVVPDDEEDPDDEEESDDEPVNCTLASPTANELGALQKLFPEEGTAFCAAKTPTSGTAYFIAVREGQTLGYAFSATNYGFDGQVVALTGVTTEAKSIAVAIMSERESWWYRMGQWFFDQFKEIDITQITLSPKYSDNCWPCSEMYDAFKPFTVDAVSGATYTSNAVTRDVWDAFYLYDEVFDPPAQ